MEGEGKSSWSYKLCVMYVLKEQLPYLLLSPLSHRPPFLTEEAAGRATTALWNTLTSEAVFVEDLLPHTLVVCGDFCR